MAFTKAGAVKPTPSTRKPTPWGKTVKPAPFNSMVVPKTNPTTAQTGFAGIQKPTGITTGSPLGISSLLSGGAGQAGVAMQPANPNPMFTPVGANPNPSFVTTPKPNPNPMFTGNLGLSSLLGRVK